MSALATRNLIKREMRQHGWRRMRERPAHNQTIVIAQEWIERRYGTTSQFLTSCGEYDAHSDQVLCGDDGFVRAVHAAQKFHWWMPVFSPADANTFKLAVGEYLSNGLPIQMFANRSVGG